MSCNCEQACTSPTYVRVPGPIGPTGATGATGSDGEDGVSAFTETTSSLTMPVVGGVASVSVTSTEMLFAGEVVQVEGLGGMEVDTVTSATTVVLENLGWSINEVAGTPIAAGAIIAPSGPEGAAGTGGAPVDATYWCRTANGTLSAESNMSALATGYVKVTTGTGVPSSTATVPYTDIDTSTVVTPTAKVLKPSATVATAGQVQDDEIEYTETEVSGTDVDWALNRTFWKTLPAGPGTTTFTFSNTTAGKSIMFTLQQNGTTARSVAWPAAVKWTGGAAPAMTTTLSAYQTYSFVKRGAVFIGAVVTDAY